MKAWGKQFYSAGEEMPVAISNEIADWTQTHTLTASSKASIDCITAFSQTDFRNEIKALTMPTLIIHGDEDKIVPIKTTSEKLAKLTPQAEYIVYEGSPHGLFISNKDKLNEDLIKFLKK
jgi:non-heme chloroperoxidase